MFGKNYLNYRKLAKTKKTVSNTKTCVQMWQSIFSYQKKDAFLKKIAIFFFEKREFMKKNPLLFLWEF
jgi:hypothetical protein